MSFAKPDAATGVSVPAAERTYGVVPLRPAIVPALLIATGRNDPSDAYAPPVQIAPWLANVPTTTLLSLMSTALLSCSEVGIGSSSENTPPPAVAAIGNAQSLTSRQNADPPATTPASLIASPSLCGTLASTTAGAMPVAPPPLPGHLVARSSEGRGKRSRYERPTTVPS